MSEGANCQCKCVVRPMGQDACRRAHTGDSRQEDFYTVETITSGPACKCACIAPPSALNPCEGDFRLQKLREADSRDLKVGPAGGDAVGEGCPRGPGVERPRGRGPWSKWTCFTFTQTGHFQSPQAGEVPRAQCARRPSAAWEAGPGGSCQALQPKELGVLPGDRCHGERSPTRPLKRQGTHTQTSV